MLVIVPQVIPIEDLVESPRNFFAKNVETVIVIVVIAIPSMTIGIVMM